MRLVQLVGIVLVICMMFYVRRQYSKVMQQVTKPQPAMFPTTQTTRRKCLMCGGTGRMTFLNLTGGAPRNSRPCPTCNATGWVETPSFGR